MGERDAIVEMALVPIEIRDSVFVRVHFPVDITKSEAEKVCRVMMAYGDHSPASVAGTCAGYEGSPSIENSPCAVCGQPHRATHAGEVERLREATDILQRLHDHDGWGGKGYHAGKALAAKEDGKAFLARQAMIDASPIDTCEMEPIDTSFGVGEG